MFWQRQRRQQPPSEQQRQSKPRNEQQQQQQQQQRQQEDLEEQGKHQTKGLSFNVNVSIAVNVHTEMTTTRQEERQQQQQQQMPTIGPAAKAKTKTKTKTKTTTMHWQLPSNRRRSNTFTVKTAPTPTRAAAQAAARTTGRKEGNGTKTNRRSISFIIIINLLILLLLCCNVCKSQLSHTVPNSSSNDDVNNNNNNNNNNNLKNISSSQHNQLQANHEIVPDKGFIVDFGMNAAAVGAVGDGVGVGSATAAGEHGTLEQVTRACVQRCVIEEDIFLDEYGIRCEKGDSSAKCYKTRCTKGCSHWYRGLQEFETCQEACSSTEIYPFDLPCISACKMAQRHYWLLQRESMASLVQDTAPEIISVNDEDTAPTPLVTNDSDSDQGLTVKWSIELPGNYLASRPFHIQYQYVQRMQKLEMEHKDRDNNVDNANDKDVADNVFSEWSNLADYDCDEHFVCKIHEGLMPFTRYRFRFELPFGEGIADVLYSPPTAIYQTPAEGAPISMPVITNAYALDDSHVAVFWKDGRFINAPLLRYRLVLENAAKNISYETFVPAMRNSYIFSALAAHTSFTVKVAMINAFGEGPEAATQVLTKSNDTFKSGDLMEQLGNSLLIVGEYSIKIKALEPSADTRVIYQSEQLISDFAMSLHGHQRLYVIDAIGELHSLNIKDPRNVTSLRLNQTREAAQFQPSKITWDWLHQRLYIAGETSSQTWTIVSMDLKDDTFEYLQSELRNHRVRQLEVEPLNGWLFWSEIDGGLTRMNLFTRRLDTFFADTTFGHFSYDARRWLLYAYNRSDDGLYELSYDGTHALSLMVGVDAISFGEWQSFVLYADATTLFVTNGTQLLRYNYATHEILDSWSTTHDLEWCWQLAPGMERTRQTTQQPLALAPEPPPRELQALLTAHAAQIEWQVPTLNPYQTPAAWRQWEYELEIMDVDSNSAYNIRNIKTNYFQVEKLQANNLYRLRVRAANRLGALGEWTAPLLTRTWPLGAHRLLWATRTGQLYETNEIGATAKRLGGDMLSLAQAPSALVTVNGTIYYVAADGHLRCVNVMTPEVNCTFGLRAPDDTQVQAVGGLAYDWRGGQLYWSDLARDCVVRADLSVATRWELLPIFGARDIEVDASRGHIYYTTQTRLARRTLNGNPVRDELDYFHVNGFAGSIRAFTLDLQQQQIFWLVRQHEGKVRLFRAPLTAAGRHVQLSVSSMPPDCVPSSLRHLRAIEALIWLTDGGKRATLARTAGSNDTQQVAAQFSVNLSGHNGQSGRADGNVEFSVVQMQPTDLTPFADVSVVPQAVSLETIRIDYGHWDDFNIKWHPISTAGNCSVYYRVLLEYDGRLQTSIVNEPFVRITDLVQQAQMALNISLTPHTYWRAGPTIHAQLSTPAAAPTQPKRLRVFVERQVVPMQAENVSALIRWDTPEHVSQQSVAVVAYRVYCWHGDELFAERVYNHSGQQQQQPLEVRLVGLRDDETYTFQVQAYGTAGRLQSNGGEKTSVQALHISSEVQAVPRVVYATSEYIGELDLDTQLRRTLVHTTSVVEHLVLMPGEERLLWVNENVELLSFVPGGAAPVKLARMRAEVLALTVDWIARHIYWAELVTEPETDGQQPPESAAKVAIYRLALCEFEGRVMQGQKLWSSAPGRLLRDLQVLPHAQTLLWLEYELGGRNATLVGRNLTDGSSLSYRTVPLWRMFAGSFKPEAEALNLVDYKGKLCVYDVQRQLCMKLQVHFNVLTDEIVDLARDAGYLYALKDNSVRAYSRRKQQLEYVVDIAEVRMLRAYNYQPYPERRCLLLQAGALSDTTESASGTTLTEATTTAAAVTTSTPQLSIEERRMAAASVPMVQTVGETYISLQLPTLQLDSECYLPLPGLRHTLHISDVASNESRTLSCTMSSVNITELHPYRQYRIQVTATSYYQLKLNLPAYVAPILDLRTACGTPSAAEQFNAQSLSPTEIEVSWQPPLVQHSERVWYALRWQPTLDSQTQSLQTHNVSSSAMVKELNASTLGYTLFGLEPGVEYELWLRVHATPLKFNESAPVRVSTYEPLQALKLLNATAYNLTLSWPVHDANLTRLILICHALNAEATENEFSLDISHNCTYIVIRELAPKTKYEFYMQLSYANVERPYHWPALESERFVYETLGDCPGSPGKPQIEHIAGEIFKVFWEPAESNGAPVLEYSLEALQARKLKRKRREAHQSHLPWAEEPEPIEDQWLLYCNTTELSCIVRELHTMRLLMFRVRARNEPYGWGIYSEESERIAEPFVSSDKRDSLVFAIIAPVAIVLSCVLALIIVCKVQGRRLRDKSFSEKSRPSIWSNFSSMQHQLIAARNRAFSMTSHSTLYTGGPLSDADIALLPQINWHQLTLLKFLGSGAFGEVFEGLLKYENEDEPEKVAIKSLRKGATESAELLQEAQLMSNFKHDNIVRLIGVCFDTESISLIMEHMEGGDLLSYLRESRANTLEQQHTLKLLDQLAMCIDVATGCSYLEDMHFVHRDLACRNCLVSSRVPSKRVVKIGDFGLARDIYKSDYYRKEGEGLLPVRWMSPESLVDGLYTTQSDVWAFGVLCWEILTLGQQPYATLNNFEVLLHVKVGGRLEQPESCPDKLYALMLECWQTDPKQRPTFRRCVTTLIAIKTDVRRLIWGGGCDDDYVSYVNSNGGGAIKRLPKLIEQDDDWAADKDVPMKSELKVRFEKGIAPQELAKEQQQEPVQEQEQGKGENIIGSLANDPLQRFTVIALNEVHRAHAAGNKNGYDNSQQHDFKIYANEGVSWL